jgi:hypothetical protein
MAKFVKELITSLTQAAKHGRGGKVKGMRVTAVELPFDEAANVRVTSPRLRLLYSHIISSHIQPSS